MSQDKHDTITFADPDDCPDCGRPAEFCGCEEKPESRPGLTDRVRRAVDLAFRRDYDGGLEAEGALMLRSMVSYMTPEESVEYNLQLSAMEWESERLADVASSVAVQS